MKKIIYRGGVIVFQVPENWIEEYEEDGGGMFYENIQDSGTLRLNILTFESSSKTTDETVVDYLKDVAKSKNGEVEILPNGNTLLRYKSESIEDGEELSIHYWQLGQELPPNHARLAVFSYTLLSSQIHIQKYSNELKMLDQEIAKAEFSPIVGA